MELSFDRNRNREERLAFVRAYARWVKAVPNEVWSRQQAEFLDSLFDNSRASISAEAYLRIVDRPGKRTRRP